jgi:predicted secreted protein
LFEQRLDLPFTPLRTETLREVDLATYNVLILPSDYGDGRGYSRALDKGTAAKISDWVRGGGVLIGIRGGAVWATKPKSGLTSVTFNYVRPDDEEARLEEEKSTAKPGESGTQSATPSQSAAAPSSSASPASSASATTDAEKKKQDDLAKKLIKYADREKQLRSEEVPGTILRATVDTTHPLGFGLNEQMPVLNDTAPVLHLTSKGENVVYFGQTNLKLSGYITPENERKVAQSGFLIRERQGRGFVVLFADNPVFRGFWDGTTRMLLNSIFFGNVYDPNAQ